MSTDSTGANHEKKERPHAWEDALILAFRDQQWQRVLANRLNKMFAVENEGKTPDIGELKAKLLTPPPLLAKLDGLAETTGGDTLTAAGGRFYLVEFKADRSGRKMEETKPLFRFLQAVIQHQRQEIALGLGLSQMGDVDRFVELSEQGHYLAYGKLDSKRAKAQLANEKTLELVPLHKLCVMAELYIDFVKTADLNDEEAAAVDKMNKHQATDLVSVMWPAEGKPKGLTISEMAAYLWVLGHLVSRGDETDRGAVVRCAVLSDTGLFLPVWGLSELILARSFFERTVSNLPNDAEHIQADLEVLKYRFKGLADYCAAQATTLVNTSTDNPQSQDADNEKIPSKSDPSRTCGMQSGTQW